MGRKYPSRALVRFQDLDSPAPLSTEREHSPAREHSDHQPDSIAMEPRAPASPLAAPRHSPLAGVPLSPPPEASDPAVPQPSPSTPPHRTRSRSTVTDPLEVEEASPTVATEAGAHEHAAPIEREEQYDQGQSWGLCLFGARGGRPLRVEVGGASRTISRALLPALRGRTIRASFASTRDQVPVSAAVHAVLPSCTPFTGLIGHCQRA